MTTQDLVDYYKGLLILQYSSQPNALATVDAVIGEVIQNQIISQVRDGFDVNTAIGAQLNILGTYVGVSRIAYGLVTGQYWSLPSYGDTLPGAFNGWASYTDPGPLTIRWLQYNDLNSLSYELTDNQMRRLIQLKAALGSCDMGLGDIDEIIYRFFSTYVDVVDNGNMSITYQHNHLDPDPDQLWSVAVLENILPHQAGVAFSVVEV